MWIWQFYRFCVLVGVLFSALDIDKRILAIVAEKFGNH